MAGAPPRAAARAVVFDTDVLVWYFRGHEPARRFLARFPHPSRAISALSVMELIQGCRDRNEVKQVRAFLSENLPRTLYPDEAACRRAVDLLEQHAGPHGLRVVDALIGATALEAGCALATANVKHYRPISRLEIVPFKP